MKERKIRLEWRARIAELVRDNWPEDQEMAEVLEQALFAPGKKERLEAVKGWEAFSDRLNNRP